MERLENLSLERSIPPASLPERSLLGEDAPAFLGKVDAALLGEADPGARLQDAVQSNPHPELIEVYVARLPNRSGQIEKAVARREPARAVLPSVHQPSRTRHRHLLVGAHDPEIERDPRRSQLPRGGRRIQAHHRSVEQGLPRIRVEELPVLLGDPPDEVVGVESGSRIQSQDAAVRRIQRHDRTGQRIRKDPVNPLHELEVEGELKVLARLTRIPLDPHQRADDPPGRVDLQIADPPAALESLLILALDPDLPHQDPLLVLRESLGFKLFRRHLAHVSERMGDGSSPVIATLRPHRGVDARKVLAALLEDRDGGEVGVDVHEEGLVAAHVRHEALDPRVREAQMRPEQLEHLPRGLARVTEHVDRVAWNVVGHDPAGAVEHGPPRCGHREGAEAVRFRAEHVVARAEHLNPEELENEGSENDGDDAESPVCPAPLAVGAVRSHRTVAHPRPLTTTTATPIRAA